MIEWVVVFTLYFEKVQKSFRKKYDANYSNKSS